MDTKLEKWREQIDKLDDDLIKTIAKRQDVVREIGKYKKAHNIPFLDEKRWEMILESRLAKALLFNLSEYFIKKIYTSIHEHSLDIETHNK